MNFLIGKSKGVESKLQERIEDLQRIADILRCFRPIQVLNFAAAIGQYKNALKIVSKSGLDTGLEFYQRRPYFLHETVWMDIRAILETGTGLFESVYEMPGFVDAQEQAEKDKRMLYEKSQADKHKQTKIRAKELAEEQRRKRAEFAEVYGVPLPSEGV